MSPDPLQLILLRFPFHVSVTLVELGHDDGHGQRQDNYTQHHRYAANEATWKEVAGELQQSVNTTLTHMDME